MGLLPCRAKRPEDIIAIENAAYFCMPCAVESSFDIASGCACKSSVGSYGDIFPIHGSNTVAGGDIEDLAEHNGTDICAIATKINAYIRITLN